MASAHIYNRQKKKYVNHLRMGILKPDPKIDSEEINVVEEDDGT